MKDRSYFFVMILLMVVAVGLAFRDQARVFAKTEPDIPAVPQLENQLQPVASDRAEFSVRVRDMVSPYNIVSVPVAPGERVSFGVASSGSESPVLYRVSATGGVVTTNGQANWTWTAPVQSGTTTLTIRQEPRGEEVRVNFLVMTPYSLIRGKKLNGYPIGSYPANPLGNNPVYTRPTGFVEVTPENENSLISPNFRLKQFLCKQESSYPKYLVLNEKLVLKLEFILEELNRRGYAVEGFHVMSGYRTPVYNSGLGNVKFSMHQFGYAADIFVDQSPADGVMDDLNQDRRIDHRDTAVLSAVIEEMDRSPEYRELLGGLGRYAKTKAHGPFVHVDVRGWDARWAVGMKPHG